MRAVITSIIAMWLSVSAQQQLLITKITVNAPFQPSISAQSIRVYFFLTTKHLFHLL